MSVVYEPRNIFHDGNYPSIGDTPDVSDQVEGVQEVHDVREVHDVQEASEVHNVHQAQEIHESHEVHQAHEVHDVHDVSDVPAPDAARFDETDVTDLAAVVGYNASTSILTEDPEPPRIIDGLPPVESLASPKSSPTSPYAGTTRSKPIPKPERDATKNLEGKFVCSWPNCKEDVQEFTRRCEWSKHMDKHDRPYKCQAEGCEKLPGFTYSGGLLRHEREVHDKHGGPKNPLHCPHATCKRHSGKGFSRQENLNEHLRRVHTLAGLPHPAVPAGGSVSSVGIGGGGGGDTDDGASESAGPGTKRQRPDAEEATDLRRELKRMRQENEELRMQLLQQQAEMMRQISELTKAVHPDGPAQPQPSLI